jgi:hypothetical protein
MAVLNKPVVFATERLESAGAVVAARGVAIERTGSDSRVGAARGVANERMESAGGVPVARGVAKERVGSTGGIEVANGVAKERVESDGGVEGAGGVVLKRACPKTAVALRPSDFRQRQREDERSNKDGEKRNRAGRMARHINPPATII